MTRTIIDDVRSALQDLYGLACDADRQGATAAFLTVQKGIHLLDLAVEFKRKTEAATSSFESEFKRLSA